MKQTARQPAEPGRRRSRVARGILLGGLLLSALWLGGCSTSSFFVFRDSWGHGHHRSYSRERWHDDCDYGRGDHRDYDRGHRDHRW